MKFTRISHILSLFPFLYLAYEWFFDLLGFEPINEATHQTGLIALVFLLLSLSCTPARILMGKAVWAKNKDTSFFQGLVDSFVKNRRILGLYSFFYATLHMLIFFVIDYELNLDFIGEAVLKKPYALVGMAGYLILFILAFTSNKISIKYLGKKWKQLHQFVYLAGLLVIIHFIWSVKSDYRLAVVYGIILVILLSLRVFKFKNT